MKLRAGSTNRRGFTLLELLIVLGMIALLTFLTTPVALRFYQNQETEETARTLKESLRRAREYSVSQRRDKSFGVKILSASSTLVLFEGPSYAARYAPEDELIPYPSSLTITGTSTEVVFSRLYGTSTISDLWIVSNGSAFYRINIPFSGVVEIQ